jgi:hypothetical protein
MSASTTHVLPARTASRIAARAFRGSDLADPASREELERACLTWIFRALFVLYAESRVTCN